MTGQAAPFLEERAVGAKLRPSREFLFRAGLVVLFVLLTHQLRWKWLRFVTSEAVLRISASLGMQSSRVSFDTIRVYNTLFCFVVACTFVDVFAGFIPLIWNFNKSVLRNLACLVGVAAILFVFNLFRLEIGQILYARGMPWLMADQVFGAFAYFAVWLVIWRLRTWQIFDVEPADWH